jgi:hypothetical protein
MIREIKDGELTIYCISAYQCWRPGSFESKKAAQLAIRHLKDEEIQRLQDMAIIGHPDALITLEAINTYLTNAPRR